MNFIGFLIFLNNHYRLAFSFFFLLFCRSPLCCVLKTCSHFMRHIVSLSYTFTRLQNVGDCITCALKSRHAIALRFECNVRAIVERKKKEREKNNCICRHEEIHCELLDLLLQLVVVNIALSLTWSSIFFCTAKENIFKCKH